MTVHRMTSWTDRVSYSPWYDCDMGRVSGFDEHCQEHFVFVVAGTGYRDRREQAVQRLMESIEAGDPAGELKNEIASR